jgi:hypothetical protein
MSAFTGLPIDVPTNSTEAVGPLFRTMTFDAWFVSLKPHGVFIFSPGQGPGQSSLTCRYRLLLSGPPIDLQSPHRLGIKGPGVYLVHGSELTNRVVSLSPEDNWYHYVIALADSTLEIVATELKSDPR